MLQILIFENIVLVIFWLYGCRC